MPNLLKMVVTTINHTIYLTTFCTNDINVFERFLLPFLLLFCILNPWAIILSSILITINATIIYIIIIANLVATLSYVSILVNGSNSDEIILIT